MFTNGLGHAGIGMTSDGFRRSMATHADRIAEREQKAAEQGVAGLNPWSTLAAIPHPAQLGMGMILEARGNVYGDVRTVDAATVAHRRRRNRAARTARQIHRKAARR